MCRYRYFLENVAPANPWNDTKTRESALVTWNIHDFVKF